MIPNLPFLDLELTLIPSQDLEWPIERRGIILRGALGHILRSVACDQICDGSGKCEFAGECAYGRLFTPRAETGAARLSKNADRPRPFVLQPELDRRPIAASGDDLVFLARLFGRAAALYPYLIVVFSELFRRGLGRDRVPCRLRQVRAGGRTIFADGVLEPIEETREQRELPLGLETGEQRPSRLEVKFLTPTYLKDRGREAREAQAAFPALVRRARDRISSLYQFHGAQASDADLPWDFRKIGDEAEQARCVADQTEWAAQTRRSTRTRRSHDLGGLIGSALYENVPARSSALLRLAQLTHVGKNATFGLGRIQVVD